MDSRLEALNWDGGHRVSSELMAQLLGIEHRCLLQTIERYKAQIEEFGVTVFEVRTGKLGGQPTRYALLNESQCHFVATLSRNSDRGVSFKAWLAKNLGAATAQAQSQIRLTGDVGQAQKVSYAHLSPYFTENYFETVGGEVDFFSLLDLAARESFHGKENASALLSIAKKFSCAGDWLYLIEAVSYMNFMSNTDLRHKYEVEAYPALREMLPALIPDSKVISRADKFHHKVDIWVSVSGIDCPVEVKVDVAGANAVKQLQRYMSVYGCEKGYLIAPGIVKGLDLPSGITFIRLSVRGLSKEGPPTTARA